MDARLSKWCHGSATPSTHKQNMDKRRFKLWSLKHHPIIALFPSKFDSVFAPASSEYLVVLGVTGRHFPVRQKKNDYLFSVRRAHGQK